MIYDAEQIICELPGTEILKKQCAAQFPAYTDYSADFWEYVPVRLQKELGVGLVRSFCNLTGTFSLGSFNDVINSRKCTSEIADCICRKKTTLSTLENVPVRLQKERWARSTTLSTLSLSSKCQELDYLDFPRTLSQSVGLYKELGVKLYRDVVNVFIYMSRTLLSQSHELYHNQWDCKKSLASSSSATSPTLSSIYHELYNLYVTNSIYNISRTLSYFSGAVQRARHRALLRRHQLYHLYVTNSIVNMSSTLSSHTSRTLSSTCHQLYLSNSTNSIILQWDCRKSWALGSFNDVINSISII